MMLRRKRSPPELAAAYQAFLRVVACAEEAKVAITHAMPTTRFAGTPMAEALAEYEWSLERAAELMPGWHVGEVEDAWIRCEEGLTEALEMARRLRTEAPDIGGFEGLVGLASQLIGALDPFADAEARFRKLRAS